MDLFGLVKFGINESASIGFSIATGTPVRRLLLPFGFAIGGGLTLRKCCSKDKKIYNELFLNASLDLAVTARSFQLSPTSKGSLGLIRKGKLPKCVDDDKDIIRSKLGIISLSASFLNFTTNLRTKDFTLNYRKGSGAAVTFGLIKGEYQVFKSTPIGTCCQ